MHTLPAPGRARLAIVAASLFGCIAIAISACGPIASVYNEYSVFGNTVPKTTSWADSGSVELGMRFQATKDGAVMGVRFYKGAGNTGLHTGTLWNNAGKKLATVTFTNETADGWQTAAFPDYIDIKAGTTYVVSYHAGHGHYAADTNNFTTSKTVGPLKALANGMDGGNSVFAYSAASAFPTRTMYTGANYYVDVVYTDRTVVGHGTPGNIDPTSTTTAKPTTTPTTAKATTTTATVKPTTTTATAAKPTTTTTSQPTSPPPSSDFPTPATTGWQHTGVTLTPYTGPCIITVSNTVIDGKDIGCSLEIKANNVTVTRSRVTSSGSGGDFGVRQWSPSNGLTLTDVEVTQPITNTSSKTSGVQGWGTSQHLTRVLVHNMGEGYQIGSNSSVVDSYIGDLHNSGNGDHTSGMFSFGGVTNTLIRHNVISCQGEACSSAASFYPEVNMGGPNDGITLDNNQFNTVGSYCVYFGYTPPQEAPNVRWTVTNNVFGTAMNPDCGEYGPVSYSNFDAGKYTAPVDEAGFDAAKARIDAGQNANYTGGWGSTWSGNTHMGGRVLTPGG